MKKPTHRISHHYPPPIRKLLESIPPMPLDEGEPLIENQDALGTLSAEELIAPHKLLNRAAGQLCLGGLWLRFNFLDRCHQIAQDHESADGNFWHAIMHRREGDFWNSKYWFRRVDDHPAFESILHEVADHVGKKEVDSRVRTLAGSKRWDPFAFVDLCEEAVTANADIATECQAIQEIEWHALFRHCLTKARALP